MEFAFFDRLGNVSASHVLNTEVAPVEKACGQGTPYHEEENAGLTVRRIELGDTPGQVQITYQMYNLPDRLDIHYDDKWGASTAETPLLAGAYPLSKVIKRNTSSSVSDKSLPGCGMTFTPQALSV